MKQPTDQPQLRVVGMADDPQETVVLIHGMLAGSRSMRSMGNSLVESGFEVIYWSYPTLGHSLQTHGQALADNIRDLLTQQSIDRLHFATHSMGSIILRVALQQVTIPDGSRVVMLAPPNSGSRLTRLPMGPLATWFPQLGELSESPDSLVNQLPQPDGVEIGVMAAQNDRVVDIDRTKLDAQRDHLVVPTTHQRLPSQPDVIDQVLCFLKHGTFRRNRPDSQVA
jgi:pimeloyl-ACP methyl ester carboxylesterase